MSIPIPPSGSTSPARIRRSSNGSAPRCRPFKRRSRPALRRRRPRPRDSSRPFPRSTDTRRRARGGRARRHEPHVGRRRCGRSADHRLTGGVAVLVDARERRDGIGRRIGRRAAVHRDVHRARVRRGARGQRPLRDGGCGVPLPPPIHSCGTPFTAESGCARSLSSSSPDCLSKSGFDGARHGGARGAGESGLVSPCDVAPLNMPMCGDHDRARGVLKTLRGEGRRASNPRLARQDSRPASGRHERMPSRSRSRVSR